MLKKVGGFLALTLFHSSVGVAFPYEVLQTDTLAREAGTLKRSNQGQFKFRTVLLTGEIKTEGTEATTDSDVLVNQTRAMQQFVIGGNFFLRLSADNYFRYEKDESQGEPRVVGKATIVETQPRLDMIYTTANNLDIVFGGDAFYTRNHEYKLDASSFTSKDSFHSAFYSRPHVAVVKHGSDFDAGFSYQLGVEKKRSLTKSNSIDNSVLELKDTLFEPATVSIFMRKDIFGSSLYGEFAAVEASGGGNKTARGATAQEDYFRVQIAGAIPLGSQSMVLEPSLIYKSLSYADNRNVSLPTIPGFALHTDLNFDKSGIPVFIGLILVKGTDGQSLREFNAKYKLIGYGGNVGINWGF
ncbi:MAG: hypothetical protein V4655_14555 [Bdellovibrionota bacterium]|nr:MAG: hypothetical protein EOP10_15525 [Pseudomonadota bacterium]